MRKSERFFFLKKKIYISFFFLRGKKEFRFDVKKEEKKVTPYFSNKHLDDQDV